MKTVNDFLDNDERVLWHGRPNYFVWVLSRILLPTVILLPLLTLLLYGIVVNKAYFLSVFLLFISLFIMMLFWEYYVVFTKKGFPKYYITSNSTIIILSELGGIKSPFMANELVFTRDNIVNIYHKQNIFEKLIGKNCRSIVFILGFRHTETSHQVELPSELAGRPVDEINETLSEAPYPKTKMNVVKDVDPIIRSVGFAQVGSPITFSSIDDFEQVNSVINEQQISEEPEWESFSSTKGLIIYALVKDKVRLARSLLYSSIIVFFLLIGIYMLAGSQELFLSVTSYYLPKILLIILGIFVVTSNTLKVITGWISPRYWITRNSLRIQGRSRKLISGVPFENIQLDRIKHVWRLRFAGDRNDSYILGIELDPVGPQRSNRRDSLISKGLKLWGGSLSYRVVVSISDSDGFIKVIGQKPQEIRQDIFEKILFYSSI